MLENFFLFGKWKGCTVKTPINGSFFVPFLLTTRQWLLHYHSVNKNLHVSTTISFTAKTEKTTYTQFFTKNHKNVYYHK